MTPTTDAMPLANRHTPAAAPAPGRTAPGRTQWADVAKGLCIVLVVLWHVIMKHYLQLDWKIEVPIPGAWGTFGEQLLPLRMPLFFTISGMFAVGALARPWRVLTRTKVAKFTYLYVLWLLIHTAVLALAPGLPTDRAHHALELFGQLTVTPSNLWYLYALALYFAIAKLTRRVPPAVLLGGALALSAAASAGLLATPGNRGGVYQNLVFFLAGLYARPLVQRLAANGTSRRLAIAGAGYAAALVALAVTPAKDIPGVWPMVSAVAAGFGVTGAAYLCRWPSLAAPLAALGRRTLPIYVIHMPVLAVLHLLLARPLSNLGPSWQYAVAVLAPAVLTAVIVAACLLAERGLRAVRATWLFDLPGGAAGVAAIRHSEHSVRTAQ